MVDKNCHNKQFVTLSVVTKTEKDCSIFWSRQPDCTGVGCESKALINDLELALESDCWPLKGYCPCPLSTAAWGCGFLTIGYSDPNGSVNHLPSVDP